MAKSPLFQKYSRRQQQRAVADYRRSAIGRAARQAQAHITGSAGRRPARKTTPSRSDVLDAVAKFAGGKLRDEIRRLGVGRTFSAIERFAKGGGTERDVIRGLFGALGPIGTLVEKILATQASASRKTKVAGQRISGDLATAAELLKAFGFGVVPPLSTADEPAAVEAMIAELEKRGYTVDKRRGGQSSVDKTDEAEEAQPGAPKTIGGQPVVTKAGKPRQVYDVPVGGRKMRVKADDPLITGAMISVSSSNVHSIGYDFDAATLKVRFLQSVKGKKTKTGGGPLYFYFNVPPELFQEMRKAASKGGWVWDHLRIRGTVSGHRFDYRLAGITSGYVPRKATLVGQEEWFLKRRIKAGGRWFESGGDMRARAFQPSRGAPDRGEPDRGTPDRGR